MRDDVVAGGGMWLLNAASPLCPIATAIDIGAEHSFGMSGKEWIYLGLQILTINFVVNY